MLNFLRTTFTTAEQEDIDQERYVEETQRFYGKRATQFVNSYQQERQWKQNYILVNVTAEGYDMKRFLEYLQKEKGKFALKFFILLDSQPNIDFFSRDELKAVIKRFKADVADGNLQNVRTFFIINFNSPREALLPSTVQPPICSTLR